MQKLWAETKQTFLHTGVLFRPGSGFCFRSSTIVFLQLQAWICTTCTVLMPLEEVFIQWFAAHVPDPPLNIMCNWMETFLLSYNINAAFKLWNITECLASLKKWWQEKKRPILLHLKDRAEVSSVISCRPNHRSTSLLWLCHIFVD